MDILKKIGIRSLLIIGILLILNSIYTRFFLAQDIQKHSEIARLSKQLPEDTQVLYIGESSNISYHHEDKDTNAISTFISQYYPHLKINDITKRAAHAGVYNVLLQQIPSSYPIETIIVTLNLRSFNAEWIYSELEKNLNKEMVLLKNQAPLINRFLLSFKAFDTDKRKLRGLKIRNKWYFDTFYISEDFPYKNVMEWKKAVAQKGIYDNEGNYSESETRLAVDYIKAYAFQIDTSSHVRINDLNEIVTYAKKKNWNIVFNILPENTEKAKELIGDELVDLMDKNAQLLSEYYQNKGVTVVNNLHLVEDKHYIDRHWTTEHYAEIGRKKVARAIATSLQTWYFNDFVDSNDKK